MKLCVAWRVPQLQVRENYSDLKVIYLQILLIDVMFYLCYVQKLVAYIVCLKNEKNTNMPGTGGYRVKI